LDCPRRKKQLIMKNLIFLFAVCSLVMAGCYYDKTDELNPGVGLFTPCDTTHPVKYSTHILYIVNNYCYSCHQGTNPSSGYHLDSYQAIFTQVQAGSLYNDIHNLHGAHQMPPSFVLDSCYMKQFDSWIANGAPNN